MNSTNAENAALRDILTEYPFADEFFKTIGMIDINPEHTIRQIVRSYSIDFFEDRGVSRESVSEDFFEFIKKMNSVRRGSSVTLRSILINGGRNKSGSAENISLELVPGKIFCVVGPTGSGKSRLLADIECLAQGDTPTGRKVLLNGREPSFEERFSTDHKLVAQLSQNMNFVMDMAVGEFLLMHAESRMIPDAGDVVKAVIDCANNLAGEPFKPESALTQLSGGQSRSLMIADTALLSSSPIILIDEIENAGVDRAMALDLLVKKEKIVLLSTHDPILALMGDARIVIKNGGIEKIINSSERERKNLSILSAYDDKMRTLRNRIRAGEMIDNDITELFR